jgi:hypothetical protein
MPARKHPALRRLTYRLPLLLLAAGCGRPNGPVARGPGVVQRIYYDSRSDVVERVQWVARTDAEWAAARARIGPASERMHAQLRPDLARETLVIATAGGGSSGAPGVDFEGYRDDGATRYVYVRYSVGCDSAADVTQAFVVGSMPRWTGTVTLVARWDMPDCLF